MAGIGFQARSVSSSGFIFWIYSVWDFRPCLNGEPSGSTLEQAWFEVQGCGSSGIFEAQGVAGCTSGGKGAQVDFDQSRQRRSSKSHEGPSALHARTLPKAFLSALASG